MKKKILALIMATAMVVGLTACGAKEEAAAPAAEAPAAAEEEAAGWLCQASGFVTQSQQAIHFAGGNGSSVLAGPWSYDF